MLSLPNILTLSRILAVPILVFLLWPSLNPGGAQPAVLDYWLAFALYCSMGFTDYFDGYLARAQGTVSKLGIFLDPHRRQDYDRRRHPAAGVHTRC